jgi:cholesterol transport system auxiliary component
MSSQLIFGRSVRSIVRSVQNAIKNIAFGAHSTRAGVLFCLAVLGLTACAGLQPPSRPVVYDFGPGLVAGADGERLAQLPPLVLAEVESTVALDSTALWYRLAYSDAQQLRAYSLARWSMTPAQLVRQRLREQIGQRRTVLQAALGIGPSASAMTLHIELDEFSQLFDSPQRSAGLVRMRATLGKISGGIERLVAQRNFAVQRPSSSADAGGGVHALSLATDAAIQEIDTWLQQVESGQLKPN